MKKFFSKIAKGFREIGKGFKKFFKSKVGRILGTILLAIALPAVGGAIFGAAAGGGAAAGATVAQTAAAATQTAAAAGSSTLGLGASTIGTVAAPGTTLAGTAAGSLGTAAGAVAAPGTTLAGTSAGALSATSVAGGVVPAVSGSGASLLGGAGSGAGVAAGEIVAGADVAAGLGNILGKEGVVTINSGADVLKVADGLTKNLQITEPNAIFNSVSDVGKASVKNLEAAVIAPEKVVTSSKLTESAETFAQIGKQEGGVSQLTAKMNIDGGVGKGSLSNVSQSTLKDSYLKLSEGIPKFNDLSLAQQEVTIQNYLSPGDSWSQSFTNPTFRNSYSDLIAKEGTSTLGESFLNPTKLDFRAASEIPGVRQYQSMGEAFKAGDSLLSKAGNVGEYIADTSISDLTRGGYTGPGGNVGVGTASVGGYTVASQFASPEFEGREMSPSTLSVAQEMASRGTAYTDNTLSGVTTDMYSNNIQDYQGSNYMGYMNSMNQKNNVTHSYGHNDVSMGHIDPVMYG